MTEFYNHLNIEGPGAGNKVGIFKEPGKTQIAADVHLKISGSGGNKGKRVPRNKVNFENKFLS